jgi:hypothetical protein
MDQSDIIDFKLQLSTEKDEHGKYFVVTGKVIKHTFFN